MFRLLGIAAILGCASVIGLSQTNQLHKLDLSHAHLVFNEDFHDLSVSANGPNTTWTAHTPWHGDFGDARFADPAPGFPFSRSGGVFHIEMRKTPDGKWQSGLLSSVDPSGHGFTLQYGYFEMRARFPAGAGVWPAFWLDSMPAPGSPDPSIEIDIVEHYGQFPAAFNSTVTVWSRSKTAAPHNTMTINRVAPGILSAGFHTYGAMVGPDWTTIYFDRTEMWKTRTPPEHKHGLGILLDLGLGGGWPIDHAPSPSFMDVDYVRAYALPDQNHH